MAGQKNQHFWPTIKPFINSKCHVQENIILREKYDIVNDAKSVAKVFNEFFTGIASDIGFNYLIPDDYGKDEVLIYLIAKYDNHPSIIAIQSAVLEHGTFEFEQVDINQIYQILVNMNDKKATGYDGIPCKLLKLGAFPLAEYYANLSIYLSLNANSLMCWNLLRSLPSLKKSTGYVKITTGL